MRACMPCLARPSRPAEGDEHAQQGQTAHTSLSARAELERLLDADDDPDAETLSLHSNIGGGRDRSSRRGAKHAHKGASKTISLWGFNLFGRPGKIALLDSDDEDEQHYHSRPRRQRTRSTQSTGSAISDTADPDASPLADSAILNLARAQEMWEPEVTLDDLAAEEAAQREREERRAARKMRKQMKRAAAALAAGADGEEFEGFPGSGSYAPNSMPDLRRAHHVDEFGEFVQAGGSVVSGSGSSNSRSRSSQPQQPPVDPSVEAADVAEADFGGETYAARRAAPSHRSNGGSDTRSGSSGGRRKARSGTSATSSVLAPPTPPPAGHSFAPNQGTPVFAPTPSPRAPEFLGATSPAEGAFPSTGLSSGGGFPSTGLGRPKGSPRTLSAAGFRDALGSS